MTYTLEIYGRTWEGFRAVYSYVVQPEQALALQSSNPQPERLAGDFSSIIDWRLISCNTKYERTKSPPITRRIDEYRTLRGFRNGMTPRRFHQLANR